MKTCTLIFSLFICATALAQPSTKIYSNDGIVVKSYDFNAFSKYLTRSSDTIYVINFWATWCQPCVAELPQFEKLHASYKNRKVKVILVSLDMKSQVESRLIPFIKRKRLQAEIIHLSDPDMNSWIPKVSTKWEGSIPATVIYSASNRIFHEGIYTYKALEAQLKTFIP